MLSTEEFTAFSKSVVPFLHVTTRIPGRKDDDLLARKGGTGFPTLLVLRADGGVAARPPGRSIAAFETAVKRAGAGAAERAKAGRRLDDLLGLGAKKEEVAKERGSSAAREFMRGIEVAGKLDPDEWLPRYVQNRADLTAPERERVERQLAMAELAKYYMPAIRAELGSAECEHAVARLFAAKRKLGGRFPEGALANRVVVGLMRWAEARKDPVLFGQLLEDLKRVRRPIPSGGANAGFLEFQQQRLEALWKGEKPPVRRR